MDRSTGGGDLASASNTTCVFATLLFQKWWGTPSDIKTAREPTVEGWG